MIVSQIANSRNDEYYTPAYAINPILKYIPPGSTVWCPFDTRESLYVQLLRKHGCRVIYTHIQTGQDFFTTPVPPCDYIISNPPYSRKTEVFQRLFDIGKPFAMLVGSVGLFDCRERFELFRNHPFEMLYLGGRVAYFQYYQSPVPTKRPPYQSLYVCAGILPRTVMFEPITKK